MSITASVSVSNLLLFIRLPPTIHFIWREIILMLKIISRTYYLMNQCRLLTENAKEQPFRSKIKFLIINVGCSLKLPTGTHRTENRTQKRCAQSVAKGVIRSYLCLVCFGLCLAFGCLDFTRSAQPGYNVQLLEDSRVELKRFVGHTHDRIRQLRVLRTHSWSITSWSITSWSITSWSITSWSITLWSITSWSITKQFEKHFQYFTAFVWKSTHVKRYYLI